MTILAILLILSPAILLTIIGFEKKQEKDKNANVFFITATIYVLIGIGFCGSLIL
ncbi:hypothetical protein ACFQ1R_10300 [Mariniflexile jejuense]|uniref:Uncharacterized protein n=1 Tax=Mariniflexile jejuense TaxID=1173582 RepID=A0ABW3JJ64_9FLAO